MTNSGVFVRFRNPEATGYYNPAWSAVYIPGMPATPSGFEIQIDNTASPDGRSKHKTGAVYAVNYPNDPPDDVQLPPSVAGDSVNPQTAQVLAWNQYRIEVQGDVITVNLNGVNSAKYTNTDPNRGRFPRGRTNIYWAAVILELQFHDCFQKYSGYSPLTVAEHGYGLLRVWAQSQFLSKARVSLQKRALRSGWKIQNLLSWAALACERLHAYMQEVSEFRTCCRL